MGTRCRLGGEGGSGRNSLLGQDLKDDKKVKVGERTLKMSVIRRVTQNHLARALHFAYGKMNRQNRGRKLEIETLSWSFGAALMKIP